MTKKLTAAFLAIIMLLSVGAVCAFADDEPVKPDYSVYIDNDFTDIVKYDAGNDKASIIKPGDKIYFQKAAETQVTYFADVDANPVGAWTPVNNKFFAFSLSGATSYTDKMKKAAFTAASQCYTVLNIDSSINAGTATEAPFDFTIAYPDKNAFIGWAVYSYGIGTTNTLVLYAVWDKQYIDIREEAEEDDDFTYIVKSITDFYSKIFHIGDPLYASYKSYVNKKLDFFQDILDKMTDVETPDNGDIGVYPATIQTFKIISEIFMRWLDSWVTPIVNLFDK